MQTLLEIEREAVQIYGNTLSADLLAPGADAVHLCTRYAHRLQSLANLVYDAGIDDTEAEILYGLANHWHNCAKIASKNRARIAGIR